MSHFCHPLYESGAAAPVFAMSAAECLGLSPQVEVEAHATVAGPMRLAMAISAYHRACARHGRICPRDLHWPSSGVV